MRDYGKVSPQFWIGSTGKKLRAEGMEAQLVAMYLMTNPHANMLGLYYCPTMFIAHETGLGIEGATKGLQSAIKAGFCAYDEDSETVWVFEMAHYQIADALSGKDLRIKGVQNEYDSLPANPYLEAFYDKYAEAFCMMTKRYSGSSVESKTEGASKGLASQEQEQEQEQEIETTSLVASKLPTCPQQEIIEMYGEILPELPFPRIWEGERQKNLAARWKWVLGDLQKKGHPVTRESGLDFFRRFFDYISTRDLLMGRSGDWTASLDWIVQSKNFAKIIQGNYVSKAAA